MSALRARSGPVQDLRRARKELEKDLGGRRESLITTSDLRLDTVNIAFHLSPFSRSGTRCSSTQARRTLAQLRSRARASEMVQWVNVGMEAMGRFPET
jgi:hypothetical protein